ncbi:MAG: alpha-L-rhamnosidase [Tannerellaceae bacterium]|nr:alpha-L-rhamnosidase [Tannerellaceae bacterium]
MQAQELPPVFGAEYTGKSFKDSRTRVYLTPQRIVWTYDGNGQLVRNSEGLLQAGNNGQSELTDKQVCVLKSTDNEFPSVLLDFGKEIQGGLQIVTSAGGNGPVKIRVRFGESVSEAMSTVGGTQGATNDHAMRDFTTEIPWLGVAEVGNTGFRFVRIDLIEPNKTLSLKEVNAIFTYRDIPYLGSFRSNDERLNRIWLTGAYTVHLNMQEYIWDGIKRDRLVWLGDLHPEVMTVSTVFGYNEVIPKSLDLARDITPLPGWMNGMCSYSLWWVIIHRDWYAYQGSLSYLREQQPYLTGLLNLLLTKVDASGKEKLDGGGRFLDWPSSPNTKGIDAGLQALMVLAFQAGADMCTALGDKSLAGKCAATAELMQKQLPPHNQLKQAAALLALADMLPAREANEEVISVGGVRDFSTFYGYYMLQAQAKAGNYSTAMDNIRQFWGGMLDMGATTFWEDFNLEWTENAAGIDELVPKGKKDIHADFGAYCYKNLRHSLCHGWASGPTAWLSEHVLGVQVVEPGCKVLRIEPHLGDLEWVEGTFPTPQGVVFISHKKGADGKIKTEVKAPKGIRIIRKR